MPKNWTRRRLLKASGASGLSAVLAGCSADDGGENGDDDDGDDSGDDSEPSGDDDDADSGGDDERGSAPEDPPAAVRGGFDPDAAFEATRAAIYGDPFAVFGHLTDYDADETLLDSQAKAGAGDTERARHVRGSSESTALIESPEDGGSVTERFWEDDRRYQRHGPDGWSYGVSEGTYEEFAQSIERDLEYYYEAAEAFEFDEPEWDPEEERYVIEGVGFRGENVPDDDDLIECEVHVDTDGVVVHIATEFLIEAGGARRTDVEGRTGTGDVGAPSWIEDAEAQLPAWEYVGGEYPYPARRGDRLTITDAEGVAGLDRFDGEELWRVDLRTARAPHVVADEAIYVAGDDAVFGLDPSSGDERWSDEIAVQVPRIILSEDLVIFTDLEHVHAYRRSDGSLVWDYEMADGIVRRSHHAADALFLGANGRMTALELESGEVRWEESLDGDDGVLPRAVADGSLFGAGLDGAIHRFDLASGTHDRFAIGDEILTLLVRDGAVYAADTLGDVIAIDAEGGSVEWQRGVGDQPRMETMADGDLLVTDASPAVNRLDPDDGTILWTADLEGRSTELVVGEGSIHLGAGTAVYAIDLEEGEIREEWSVEAEVPFSPSVTDEFVYVSDNRRTTYAFER